MTVAAQGRQWRAARSCRPAAPGKAGGARIGIVLAFTLVSAGALAVVLLFATQIALDRVWRSGTGTGTGSGTDTGTGRIPARDAPRAPFAERLVRDWLHITATKLPPVSDSSAEAKPAGGGTPGKHGVGVYYVSYGSQSERFVHDAYNSARNIRRLNPSIQTAIATNYRGPLLRVFNHTVHIPDYHFDESRQWLTRLYYLAMSPFELTVEIDSTVTVCSTTLVEDLEAELASKRFDFASQVEYISRPANAPHIVHPHNFVLMYFWNANAASLFSAWFDIYKDTYDTLDDQKTLSLALRSPSLPARVRFAKVKDSFAMGFLASAVCSSPGSQARCTRAISGKMSMFHSFDGKRLPERHKNRFCEFYNENTARRQLVFKLSDQSEYKFFTNTKDCTESGFGETCRYLEETGVHHEDGLVEELATSDAWIRAVHSKKGL
jgi:hypothetical protein